MRNNDPGWGKWITLPEAALIVGWGLALGYLGGLLLVQHG